MKNQTKAKVFISYSHHDEEWKNFIKEHFTATKKFEVWNDRDIVLGENWFEEIEDSLHEADIAILLISRNFLNSDFIENKEIPHFLKRCKEGSVQIVTIMIQPCAWRAVEWLSYERQSLQGFPKDNKPLSGLVEHNVKSFQDSHMVNEEISSLVVTLYETYKTLNPHYSQLENFLQSIQKSLHHIDIKYLNTLITKYMGDSVYLHKLEGASSVKEIFETLYDTNQKEVLGGVLHELSDSIALDSVLQEWVDNYYRPIEPTSKPLEFRKTQKDRVFIIFHDKNNGSYDVHIYARYINDIGNKRVDIELESIASHEELIEELRYFKKDIPLHLIIPKELYLENFRWLSPIFRDNLKPKE